MIIKGTNIEIPDSLNVYNLNLVNTGVTELPEGLTVGGYLNLNGTEITKLPVGLTVDGDLYFRYTSITELPDSLNIIDGRVYCNIELIACEKLQLELIKQSKSNITIFKDPTATAIRLHDMLWVI